MDHRFQLPVGSWKVCVSQWWLSLGQLFNFLFLFVGIGNYTFPVGTTFAANDYIVIVASIVDFNRFVYFLFCNLFLNVLFAFPNDDGRLYTISASKVFGSYSTNNNASLSNSGELLQLRNAAKVVVSSVQYDTRSPWPLLAGSFFLFCLFCFCVQHLTKQKYVFF